ncbi:MAG TPA: Fe2+-dependent dioxygenase [Alphaproteobacteria bacterium]|nr:Fe2+-dependent dioxygenase [Alphaproteobacteria bacterium]
MLVHISHVLSAEQVAECRTALAAAEWVDGRATAGHHAAKAKDNMQVPEGHPASRKLGAMILAALERNALFVTAALPAKVYPPLFNRYQGGQTYGTHVDGAIRDVRGTPHRVRTDLSATLFLSPPEDYDGGELVIEDTYGAHKVKLPAGDMILYPGTSLHRVEPVSRGTRLAAFFWVQSMVRDDGERTLLLDLDTAIQQVGRALPEHAAVGQLLNVYHNLLRRWAEG